MRPSSTSLAIRLTGNRAVSWPAGAAPRMAAQVLLCGAPKPARWRGGRSGPPRSKGHHHLLLLASTAAPSYAAGPRQQSITKWIRPDGGVGKHGWSPSGGDAKETAPRLRLFHTRIVQIALRYHDGVARVRYLLTNALSACSYGAPQARARSRQSAGQARKSWPSSRSRGGRMLTLILTREWLLLPMRSGNT
jgi:hypothetical protein